jgi:hypothetical protein
MELREHYRYSRMLSEFNSNTNQFRLDNLTPEKILLFHIENQENTHF